MRPYSRSIVPFLFVFPIFFAGCSGGDMTEYNLLASDWSYAPGFYVGETELITDAMRYRFKTLYRFDNLNTRIQENSGYVWLRNEFSIPEDFELEGAALTLGRISLADKTYLNGILIGTGGQYPPKFFSAWNQTRLYTIPKNLLRKDKNTLLVKVFVEGEGSLSGQPFLGSIGIAKTIAARDQLIFSTSNAAIMILVILIGLLYMVIYLNRRKDRENLFYSLMCLEFTFILSNFIIAGYIDFNTFPLSFLTYQKISFTLLCSVVFTGMIFIYAFIGRHIRKRFLILNAAATGIPALIIWLQFDYASFYNMRNIVLFPLLIPVVESLFVLALGVVQKRRDIWMLILGMSPLLAALAHDLVSIQILKRPDSMYLSSFGFTAFIISMSLILANRFTRIVSEVEMLNRTLEEKVNYRTAELSAANKKLTHAQKIATMDLDMAVNIQTSILLEKPPVISSWDIAFEFRPMTGVSGDFYQFFTKEGKLVGAGIFDVSGHGIASGLITMVANSVISRIFMSTLDKPLGSVMSEINSEIISEIGNVDNYLTGILLRFNDDIIEYVNAGHTDLLIRRKGIGVKPVRNRENEFRGMFLGIEGMGDSFRALRFRIKEGDELVLFTDYVLEAHNGDRKGYGLGRFMDSFNSAGADLSAREILDYLMNDLEKYTCGRPLTDDCTVIVIKRVPEES